MNSYKNTRTNTNTADGISDLKGIGVIAKRNESFDNLIKRFKRTVSKAGIIKEVQARRFYEKDSVKRNRKKSESIKRNKTKGEKIENNHCSRR